jgi:co-chaperonin GroES (HSP10)
MIEPCGHLVLVQLDEVKERTAGGMLYVPDTVRETHQKAATTGVILAVGRQAWQAFGDGTPWAGVGDRVCFPRYSGITVDAEITGLERCVLCNDEDCKAVIAKGAAPDYNFKKET